MNIFTFPAWPAADPANPGPGTAPAQRWRRGTGVPRSSSHLLRAAPIPSLLFKPLGFLISMTTGLPVRERRAVPECAPQALSRISRFTGAAPRRWQCPCPGLCWPRVLQPLPHRPGAGLPSRGWEILAQRQTQLGSNELLPHLEELKHKLRRNQRPVSKRV